MPQHTLAGEAIGAFLAALSIVVVAAILLAGLTVLVIAATRQLGEWRRGRGGRSLSTGVP
ncbi:MAG: hypothetical protein ACRDMH_16275 [Solirubrobacterales bacterium]